MSLSSESAVAAKGRFSGLAPRLISISIILPLVIVWNILGGTPFFFVLAILAALMTVEWWRITWRTGYTIAFAGFPYILLSALCLQQIRLIKLEDYPDFGMYLVFVTIGLLAVIDSAAYFFGKLIGGKKLAPRISPNKTWAGLIGAMVTAGIFVVIAQGFLPPSAFRVPHLEAFLAGAALAVIAQAGDLLESWLKRLAGVKDAGALIPGHGGLLDRADGYLAALPFIWLWCLRQGWM